MLGKLSWQAIPFDQPIPMAASLMIVVGMLAILSLITWKGWWPYLWREWLTSVDHKRIGVMYVLLALVLLLRGFMDAIMMRSQLAIAAGSAQGYLPPEHYDQIFSAHGTIMIFFMAMPFMVGLMNFVVPLQLGVRDVAFPVLTATFGMLLLDRYVGMHFFTNDGGGNFMMYINLIWIWGHPEVYILALPAFGIFSEVIATFAGKALFGYRSMVMATLAICVLSFLVW